MRFRLLAILLGIATFLAAVQVLTPEVITDRAKVTATIPPIICPDSANGAYLAVGGRGALISPVGKLPKTVKEVPLKTSKEVTSAQVSTVAHLVENSVGGVTQIDTSSGLSGLACPTADASYWFVGGSAALTSQDRLIMTNAGHGDATATILAWGSGGAIPAYPVVVPAQTSIRVGLDSIAPGMGEVVLHVLVRSGRMAVSLYDQRVQGLTNLGSDFVPPGIEPAKKFVVLGVPRTLSASAAPATAKSIKTSTKKSKAATPKQIKEVRILRLLSPTIDSSVRVDAVGAGDSFTPLGLDSIELKAGIVRDIPVTAAMPSSAYAFVITADSPVVAGVFSTVVTSKGSDIAWSASARALSLNAVSADFDGTTYFFYSHTAMVVQITSTRTGVAPVTSALAVPAEDVVSWSPTKSTGGVYAVQLKFIGGVVYAARVLRANSGITTSPLRPINTSNESTASMADVGVGMPR